jgi:acyl-homoserine-lactone acylase
MLKSVTLVATAMVAIPASGNAIHGKAPDAEQAIRHPRTGTVAIIRDPYGTPHIYARREEDGYFGLGEAYGEDRLQQVLLSYLRAQGRLAEIFGPGSLARHTELALPASTIDDTVASDIEARRYRYLEDARDNFARLPVQLQRNLRSFVAGLQAYMRRHPERVPVWAPELEPALPIAVLSQLTGGGLQSICEAKKAVMLAPEPADQSNAWAVARTRSANRAVLFSSDSHGGLDTEFGPTFYNWRMKAGAIDALSFDIPGTASFFFGHSGHYAWGWTEGERNTGDCYAVQTEPQSPRSYRFDAAIRGMEVIPYSIAVKGATPVTGQFEYTAHNGIRSPVVRRDGNTAYVASTPYFGRSGLAAGAYYRMATARNRKALVEALALREIYPANLVVGGTDGTVLYIRPGRIAERKPGIDAATIVPGNSSTTEWRGIHDYASLLKIVDPPQGFVSNSNVSPDQIYTSGAPAPEDYPAYFGFQPGRTTTRQRRLLTLLSAEPSLTIDRAQAIVMDDAIPGAEKWGIAIAAAQRSVRSSESVKPMFDDLAGFDGHFTAASRGALYFAMLRSELTFSHGEEVDAIVQAIESDRPLTVSQQAILVTSIEACAAKLLKAHGTIALNYGDLHRIANGETSLPASGASFVAGRNLPGYAWHAHPVAGRSLSLADTVRKSSYDNGGLESGNTTELLGGQRIPFLVSLTTQPISWSLLLPGIGDAWPSQLPQASAGQLKPTYFSADMLAANAQTVRIFSPSKERPR